MSRCNPYKRLSVTRRKNHLLLIIFVLHLSQQTFEYLFYKKMNLNNIFFVVKLIFNSQLCETLPKQRAENKRARLYSW